MEPAGWPASNRILPASRKHLPSEIVEQAESVFATHVLSQRLKLLKDLRSSIAEKDEWMKEYLTKT